MYFVPFILLHLLHCSSGQTDPSAADIFVSCALHEDAFRCVSDGRCIAAEKRCDSIPHCVDQSDEVSCSQESPCPEPLFFRCERANLTAACIPVSWRCDGDNDCGDFSDETDCEPKPAPVNTSVPTVCPNSEFRCGDGICIPNVWKCDGREDCQDGADEREEECNPNHTLKPCEGFRCSDPAQSCIPDRWVCDEEEDCPDGSDELESLCRTSYQGHNCSIAQGKFKCGDLCLDHTKVCDQNKDCDDGSDEGPFCESACPEPKKCQQGCIKTKHGGHCFCRHGYRLGKDRESCEDVDECQTQNGMCGQVCINTVGGHKCECVEGYSLHGNHSCRVKQGAAMLVFATRTEIRRLDITGHRLYSQVGHGVLNRPEHAVGIAVDGQDRRVYWSDAVSQTDVLESALFDGRDQRTFVNDSLQIVEDIAVDYVTRMVYFTDSSLRQIRACSIVSSDCTAVLKLDSEAKPRSIALHHPKGMLFYTDWGNERIGRAGLDGKDRKIIVRENITWANGITVDITTDRIFWCDAKFNRLETADLDGKHRFVITSYLSFHPFSVAVFEDYLFWSDWDFQNIQATHKFTGKGTHVVVQEPHLTPMGIEIYHPLLEPDLPNPCRFSVCSHICLRNMHGEARCKCPDKMALFQNTCVPFQGTTPESGPPNPFQVTTPRQTTVANNRPTRPTTTMTTSSTTPTTTTPTTTTPTTTTPTTTTPTSTTTESSVTESAVRILHCSMGIACADQTKCIARHFKCDGTPDCADGSDERDCPTTTTTTSTTTTTTPHPPVTLDIRFNENLEQDFGLLATTKEPDDSAAQVIAQPVPTDDTSTSGRTAAGVVCVLFLLVLTMCGCYYVFFFRRGGKRGLSGISVHFRNPTFGVHSSGPIASSTSNETELESVEVCRGDTFNAYDNPGFNTPPVTSSRADKLHDLDFGYESLHRSSMSFHGTDWGGANGRNASRERRISRSDSDFAHSRKPSYEDIIADEDQFSLSTGEKVHLIK